MSDTASEARKPTDYKSDLKPIWCPGCGDFGVLASLYRALAQLEFDPAKTVIVSGIGCSSRLPGFVSTYGFHTLHGRPLPTAMGVKMANPELNVIAVGGDGDGFAIGAGHFPHAARRNMDITYLVMDNETYGLTKGQNSPTSEADHKAAAAPFGNQEAPLNTLAFAVACEASFIARGASFNTKALTELMVQAVEHKGFSFIDALSPCVVFNNTTDQWKALVTDIDPDHDVTDRGRAFEMALRSDFSLGILYKVERPTLNDKYQSIIGDASESDVERMLDTFSTVKGAAIGKPTA